MTGAGGADHHSVIHIHYSKTDPPAASIVTQVIHLRSGSLTVVSVTASSPAGRCSDELMASIFDDRSSDVKYFTVWAL